MICIGAGFFAVIESPFNFELPCLIPSRLGVHLSVFRRLGAYVLDCVQIFRDFHEFMLVHSPTSMYFIMTMI